MIPPVLLLIWIRADGKLIPLPIPVIVLWPLLLVALAIYNTPLHAVARLFIAARGLKVDVAGANGERVLIQLI